MNILGDILNDTFKTIDMTYISKYDSFYIDDEIKGGVYMDKKDIKEKARELLNKLDEATSNKNNEKIQEVSKEIVNFLLELTELE